ncbi:MAG: ABC transporter substrate-binding protein [Actinomycetaceae bacterium]|nr:ABC transporter substrate-binding protein [Actinomycetaceae bacterium]
MSTTRRKISSFVAVLAVFLAGACSSGESSDSQSSGTSSGDTRTVTDGQGRKVEVPKEPERVVVLNDELLDDALALDVTPVAITNGQGQPGPATYLQDRVGDIPVIGDVNRPNIESIVSAKPDLILMSYVLDEDELSQLEEIAPTYVANDDKDYWKDTFTRVGDALNRGDDAEKVLSDYDASVQSLKGDLGDKASSTVTIARWNADGPVVMGDGSFAATVLADVGLTRPESQADITGQGHGDPISLEALNILDADWIFVSALDPSGPDGQALTEGTSSEAFRQVPAVAAGHTSTVDGSVWGAAGGPLASQQVLDDVRSALVS